MAETLSFTASASKNTNLKSGTSYPARAIGKTAESPYSTASNWYGPSGNAVDSSYVDFTFDLSSIPSNATDIVVGCKVAGKAENATYNYAAGGRYSIWGLCYNGTLKSEKIHATKTSVAVLTIPDSTWTREELDGLQLRHWVGYYGGSTTGITLTITYNVGGGETTTTTLYLKRNDAFVGVQKIYKKVNGSWTEVDTIDTDTNYILG